MWRHDRVLIGALGVLLLAGCASSGPAKRSGGDEERREAAGVQVKLGRGYMEQGQLETAMEKLQRALQLDPRNVDAHTMMAVLNERINRPEQAETYYRKAERLAPENGDVNNNLGAFLCSRGDYARADAYFSKALADPFYRSPTVALGNAGVCALKAGDSAKAEGYFRQVIAFRPDDATALFELARISFMKNDNMRARAFLQRLEASIPADPALLDLGRRIETRLGDRNAAQRYATRLQNEFPDYVPDSSLQGSTTP